MWQRVAAAAKLMTYGCSYVCANFGKNRSKIATVRVPADGQTHRQTQTDFYRAAWNADAV